MMTSTTTLAGGKPYMMTSTTTLAGGKPCMMSSITMHKFDPEQHWRRSIRLPNYDYNQTGAYFVTLVTQDRATILGDIVDGEVRLTTYGHIVYNEWLKTPMIRFNVDLDLFMVMPNHLHGIIIIQEQKGFPDDSDTQAMRRKFSAPIANSLSSIIGQYKSITTKKINSLRGIQKTSVWQRNYYERIVRDENEMNALREYILENPMKWESDRENPFI